MSTCIMQAYNMKGRTGQPVPDQVIVIDNQGTDYFFSYNRPIIMRKDCKVYLDPDYYVYSKTTVMYRNQFLGLTSKEIDTKIKKGEYILKRFNS